MTSVQDYWLQRKHLLEILHMPCMEDNNGLPPYHHHGTGKTRG
jgi:hypothetical protein